jgi:hypothetical protein
MKVEWSFTGRGRPGSTNMPTTNVGDGLPSGRFPDVTDSSR